ASPVEELLSKSYQEVSEVLLLQFLKFESTSERPYAIIQLPRTK
ncbi:9651_t:CDS:1, partial [Gigaspora rosea]